MEEGGDGQSRGHGGQARAPIGAAEPEGHLWDLCGTRAGPARAELAPALFTKAPAGVWPSSCPAWLTTPPSPHPPTPGLGWELWGVHCRAGGVAGMRSDPAQPRTVAVVTATTMSLPGPGARQRVLTAARQHRGVRGLPVAAGVTSGRPRRAATSRWPRWPWGPSPASQVATAEPPPGTGSRNTARGGDVKRSATRLSSLTQARGARCLLVSLQMVFTRNKPTLLRRQTQADAGAHGRGLSRQLSRHPGSAAQPRKAGPYRTPSAVRPARLCPHPCCRGDPGLHPSQCPRPSPAPVASQAPTSLSGVGEGPGAVRACVGSSAPQTSALPSHRDAPELPPLVNRPFPFLSLLYVAAIPLS